MTDLSPAAQAVLDAVCLREYDVPAAGCPWLVEELSPKLATALRAVARHASYCIDGSDYYVIAKDDLLAIAAELEGAKGLLQDVTAP